MRGACVAATLMTGLALATPAAAGEPTDTLRRLFDQANRILSASDVTDDARLTALRTLVREVFNAREAAALALGRDWTARTAAERDEFSRLYGDVLEGAYLGGVGSRARLHGDGIRVAFASESIQGTSATVLTTLETRSGVEIPIEYRLTRREAGWAVVDVVVDRLRDHGVMVVTGGRGPVPLARVLVGPFTNRAAATSALRDLAAGGYRAFIAVE